MIVCLTLLFWGLIESDSAWGGPVILTLSASHGVHLGDLPVAVVWLLGVLATVRLGRRPKPAAPTQQTAAERADTQT